MQRWYNFKNCQHKSEKICTKVISTAFFQKRPVLWKMLKLLLLVKLAYQILQEGKNIERSSQGLLLRTEDF